MSRYTVGQKVAVIAFVVKPAFLGHEAPATFFRPWADTVVSQSLVWLTVMEEHQVSGEYDDKDQKKHLGYVAVDGHGYVWHNQYPSAKYGQISTEGDVRWNMSSVQALTTRFGVNWMERVPPLGYIDLLRYLERAYRGVLELLDKGDAHDLNAASALQAHIDELTHSYEGVTGMKLLVMPCLLRRIDSRLATHVLNSFPTVIEIDPKTVVMGFVAKWRDGRAV